MSNIQITINLDSNDSKFDAVLAALTGATAKSTNAAEVVQAEEVKTPAPRSRTRTTAAATPAKVEEPEPVEETEEQGADLLGEEETEAISYDDLKALLAQKVTANRDAIVKKLKELGGSKISDLPKENYQALYDFMAKLK